MAERQEEFGFMEERDEPHWVAIRGLVRKEIQEAVTDAVGKAIRIERTRAGVDFVSEGLKELFEEALEVYFKPIQDDFQRIAESYRKDTDEADWWKGGGDDE